MPAIPNNLITDVTLNAIIEHAAAVFPQESCGLVLKRPGGFHYLRCENTSPTPKTSFLIDPLAYAKCASSLAFVVHSHPNRSATPSDADKACCERADVPFLILSYPSGELQTIYPRGYVANYANRPFVYGVFDCFSLVRDYYRHKLSIELPDRARPPFGWWLDADNSSCLMDDYQAWGFKRVGTLAFGDIIVMQLQGVIPNHVALYLGDGIILHQTLNAASREEQYGSYWRKNTICYLRYGKQVIG